MPLWVAVGTKWVCTHRVPGTLPHPWQGLLRIWNVQGVPSGLNASFPQRTPKPFQRLLTYGSTPRSCSPSSHRSSPCYCGIRGTEKAPSKDTAMPGRESNVLGRGTQEEYRPPHPCRPPHGKASFPTGRWTCTRTGKKLNETKWSIIRMAIKAEGRSKAVNSINSANKCSGMILLCSEPARGRCCLLSFAY